ncbi:hypothetical protein L2E82_30240 [Cichorium intybus]|uniref:Uncharacterized protein n=1 Tax=Cichorium intybus TaxID=13427 RepID=A0ACB9D058_CICIN|nr:hypothetical protein L2E82_30240 [Cichorium intybus]
MNFTERWRKWIKGCLVSRKESVLVNSSSTREFQIKWGVRQGDPMAPFLFVLAIEGLTVSLKEACSQFIYNVISLPNNGPVVSYLIIRVRRWLVNMSLDDITVEDITNELTGEVMGQPFVPPVSTNLNGASTSSSGGVVLAPPPIPPCTQSTVPLNSQLVINPVGNPASDVLTWGAPTRDGTPRPRQPVQVPQPQQQPPVHKPQPSILQIQPQPQQQQQYQYQVGDQGYDDEDEGWMPKNPVNQNQQWNRGQGAPQQHQHQNQWQGQQYYNNEMHNNSNFVPPLYFAQPIRKSVASYFQPREYDDTSPIYFPDNVESQIEIRAQLLGVLPEFRGYRQDDLYNHLYEFLTIANANIPRNTNRNYFRLRLFPFTLKDKAKY